MTLTREVTHIHGVGFDPADGVVYAGTHEGVWKVTGTGDVTPVGTSDDDFMGFTIASANNWISSGHPGATSKAANPLGLIQSSDKGLSWKQVSLAGQTDFHALAAKDASVVGYDADGAIMSSANGGATWTTGASVSVASLAFAGDSLLATSQQGLLRSTDSGKSFTPVPSAPKAVLLAAGSAGSVWCVDSGGTAWSSADAGKTWKQRAKVGEVSALAAVDATTSYAITPTTLIKIS